MKVVAQYIGDVIYLIFFSDHLVERQRRKALRIDLRNCSRARHHVDFTAAQCIARPHSQGRQSSFHLILYFVVLY